MNKVIIIGGGCAGLTAAIYAARANLNPIVFANNLELKGGLLTKTFMVDNYPGFPEGILGYDLIENLEKQAIKYGAQVIDVGVKFVTADHGIFIVTDDSDKEYKTLSIIIATGSTPNKLGLENEDELWGKGISSCAVCDGALYKNKRIVVVGGGDTACEEADFLTRFSNVTLLLRSDKFRASSIMRDKILKNSKISVKYSVQIKQLNGTDQLESIILNTGEEIFVDGLFYGLGLKPNSSLFKNLIKTDADGYILRTGETGTSVPGIFVAGDVADKHYRQAIVAAGDGCKAAMDVSNYLSRIN